MRTSRWIYLLTLGIALGFCVANGRWLSWILFLTALALPWLSLLMSFPAMCSARIKILAPKHLQIGCAATVSAPVTSKWLELPTLVRLSVTKPLTGESWTLRPGDALPVDHCGGLIVVPCKAKCCDLLGLFTRKLNKLLPIRVYVMPQPKKQTAPAGLQQYTAHAWHPKPGGGYSEQHELREYRPGDNLNQIHWKLSAKTGDLIIREPMEPLDNRLLLTMDLSGTPAVLDGKFAQLLGLGEYLLEQNLHFSVLTLTGNGLLEQTVASPQELQACMETLLCAPCATGDSVLNHTAPAAWCCHIGGADHEV